MTLLLYIILFLFILVILFSTKLYTKSYIEKNNKENFCQNIDDKCIIDQYGEHNCCKGTYCVRKDDNFEYKVCSNKPDPYEKNKNNNQNGFQKFITDTVGKFVEFTDNIDEKLEDLTEEEQFILDVKDACSSSYKIKIPNLFYKNKNCDCSKYNNNDDDEDLLEDINMQNCQIFPI